MQPESLSGRRDQAGMHATDLATSTQRSAVMFKVIGALVVYGFAAFGLSMFMQNIESGDSER